MTPTSSATLGTSPFCSRAGRRLRRPYPKSASTPQSLTAPLSTNGSMRTCSRSSRRIWWGLDDLQRRAPTGGHLYWRGDRGQLWVTCGKTPSEYIFSELPQVADIVRSVSSFSEPTGIADHCVLGPNNSKLSSGPTMRRDHPE